MENVTKLNWTKYIDGYEIFSVCIEEIKINLLNVCSTNWKFGFSKRVHESQISILKNLESWRFKH